MTVRKIAERTQRLPLDVEKLILADAVLRLANALEFYTDNDASMAKDLLREMGFACERETDG